MLLAGGCVADPLLRSGIFGFLTDTAPTFGNWADGSANMSL